MYTIKIKDCQIKVYNCKKEQADFYSRVKGFTENIIIFDGVTITKSNILNLTMDIPTFVNQLNTQLAACAGSGGSGGSVLPPGTILPNSSEEYTTQNIELSAQTADISVNLSDYSANVVGFDFDVKYVDTLDTTGVAATEAKATMSGGLGIREFEGGATLEIKPQRLVTGVYVRLPDATFTIKKGTIAYLVINKI